MSTMHDGLRANERAILERARAGEPPTAGEVEVILTRLARSRAAVRDTLNNDARMARADSFDEVCDGFVAMLKEVGVMEQERDAANRRAAATRQSAINLHRYYATRDVAMHKELVRLRAELDRYRQEAVAARAARDIAERDVETWVAVAVGAEA